MVSKVTQLRLRFVKAVNSYYICGYVVSPLYIPSCISTVF